MGCSPPPSHLGKLSEDECSAEVRQGVVETGGYTATGSGRPAANRMWRDVCLALQLPRQFASGRPTSPLQTAQGQLAGGGCAERRNWGDCLPGCPLPTRQPQGEPAPRWPMWPAIDVACH